MQTSKTCITKEELNANPVPFKTLSVKPSDGADKIRLLRIGQAENQIDLQPGEEIHVLNTDEIG